MSQIVTITVPDSVANQYGTWDELKNSVYESMIISEFQKGFLSIGESAQLLGLTYEGFIEWLGERKLSFITATPQELDESYQSFKLFMQSYKKP